METQGKGSPMWWAVFFRGAERILITLSGTLTVYLGYELYKFGVSAGQYQVIMKGDYGKIAVSGVGPGLLMILFGAVILVYAMHKNVKTETSDDGGKTTSVITEALQSMERPAAKATMEINNLKSPEDYENWISNYKGKDPVPVLLARIKGLELKLSDLTEKFSEGQSKVESDNTPVRESEE